MKGIIFNLVEEAVSASHGEATWDRLLLAAGVGGAYTSLGDYPDEELHALVDAASALLGVPADEVLRSLGGPAALGLARHFPRFFEPHDRTRDLVLTLNDVIHPEVRKVHPDAEPPEFGFRVDGDDLWVDYRSRRGLCALAGGMLEGAATYYGERATVVHESCAHRGDPEGCVLRCRFEPADVR